ncbi:MAG: hypothetical protein RIQ81_408 [Pseudomonadota bacterium]
MSRPPKRFWDDDENSDSFEKFSKIRKREKKKSRASDLGESFEKEESTWKAQVEGEGGFFAARVVEVHKRYAFVSAEPVRGEVNTSDVWLATIAKRFLTARREQRNFVCVGDRVLCRPAREDELASTSELPQCLIESMAPRQTRLARRDPSTPEREHVLCSNLDQLAIVASFRMPLVKWGLIDRYLVLAESEGISPIIVLNKRDMLDAGAEEIQKGEQAEIDRELGDDTGHGRLRGLAAFRQKCEERMALYRDLGYQVFTLQANAKGAGKDPQVKDLRQALKGKVTAFSGHSGVGKSSIVNLFKPELIQAVEPDEDIFYKGRHTTSYASFIKLGTGGFVIDTPGVRSFLIREDSPIHLTHCFVEMRPFLGKCGFRECRHVDEPGCLVLAAVESGKISRWRYKSYLGLLLGTTGRQGRTRDLEVEEP